MPTYVVLINWTDQGIRNVKQTAERTDHGGDIAEKHGLKLKQAYWTMGPYDMVAVFEAPDDEAMSAHLLEIGSSMGTIRTTTLRAYDEQEMSEDTPEARLSRPTSENLLLGRWRIAGCGTMRRSHTKEAHRG